MAKKAIQISSHKTYKSGHGEMYDVRTRCQTGRVESRLVYKSALSNIIHLKLFPVVWSFSEALQTTTVVNETSKLVGP